VLKNAQMDNILMVLNIIVNKRYLNAIKIASLALAQMCMNACLAMQIGYLRVALAQNKAKKKIK